MQIVHIHSSNLGIFEEALEGTGCHINGSRDVDYMIKSLSNYNCRDIMGLIVYRKHLTRKVLRLIRTFDNMFVFNPLPIVVICDDAQQLYAEKKLRVKNSPLFLLNSLDGTISDVDVRRVFATLCMLSEPMYDLSAVEARHKPRTPTFEEKAKKAALLADDVLATVKKLGGSP